jgi:hypothetical protein
VPGFARAGRLPLLRELRTRSQRNRTEALDGVLSMRTSASLLLCHEITVPPSAYHLCRAGPRGVAAMAHVCGLRAVGSGHRSGTLLTVLSWRMQR